VLVSVCKDHPARDEEQIWAGIPAADRHVIATLAAISIVANNSNQSVISKTQGEAAMLRLNFHPTFFFPKVN